MKQVKTKELTTFEKLSAINVNSKVEKKNNLTYLSWAWAWSEVKKACPDATYQMGETEYDEALGFMCHTSVCIEDETLEMWLPVMDGANKSMKKVGYKYTTRYGDKEVAAATTFDINKTMMRCLVKNLAMFGLGIYIYAGEDMPASDEVVMVTVPPVAVAVGKKLSLKKGDGAYAKVMAYAKENKAQGAKRLVDMVALKYAMTNVIKTEITNIVNSK